jgi:hypothetical protein
MAAAMAAGARALIMPRENRAGGRENGGWSGKEREPSGKVLVKRPSGVRKAAHVAAQLSGL